MTTPSDTVLPADQPPHVGQLVTIGDATWRIEHVDQRTNAYGVVGRWVEGHRPAGAGADGVDLYVLVTVARRRRA